MVLLLLGTLALAWPQEIVFQGPAAPNVEYQAHLAAHADLTTPTQALLKNRVSTSDRESLVAEFAAAQKAFLSGETDDARKKIEALLAKLPAEDWHAQDREIFLKAALRRAQLAAHESEVEPWLKWALAAGHDLPVDRTLFPPPLVAHFLRLKNSIPYIDPHPPGIGADWSAVLINGKICTAESCARVPSLDIPVRVTWLSDKWQPQSFAIPVDKLPRRTVPNIAWVSGTCEEPKFAPATKPFSAPKAFFGLECSQPKKVINLQPVARADGLTMFNPPKRDRPIYKSPWLWAGVGTAIAILVVNSQKQSEKKEPTTTYGY